MSDECITIDWQQQIQQRIGWDAPCPVLLTGHWFHGMMPMPRGARCDSPAMRRLLLRSLLQAQQQTTTHRVRKEIGTLLC